MIGIKNETAEAEEVWYRVRKTWADAATQKGAFHSLENAKRFARNTVTILKFARELKELGVGIFFEEQNINTLSGDGEMMLAVLASFAQEESRSIGRLSSREVHRIHRWGRTFDGDGCGLHAENTGPHQGF